MNRVVVEAHRQLVEAYKEYEEDESQTTYNAYKDAARHLNKQIEKDFDDGVLPFSFCVQSMKHI